MWMWEAGQAVVAGKPAFKGSVSSELSSLKSMSLSFDLIIWPNMIVSFIPVYVLTVNLCTELNIPFINL